MRRRIPYRVCSSMPDGVVKHLEARMLIQLVNREIHPIRCASSCKVKYLKGMRIGDLCAETGHFHWAMKIWRFTERLIEDKDYDDWLYVWFNPVRVRLSDVISETECELLSRRRSDLWRALGLPREAWWNRHRERIASETFGSYYQYLYLEKYDYNPAELQVELDEMWEEMEKEAETERIFREGMGEYLPPS